MASFYLSVHVCVEVYVILSREGFLTSALDATPEDRSVYVKQVDDSHALLAMTDQQALLLQIDREAHLVGHVKEGEQLLLLHDRTDLLPLVRGGIHPSGVVCAGM